MWGHGGVASVIADKLQERFPLATSWEDVLAAVSKGAERSEVGVIDDEKELRFWLDRGYYLTNYDADGCSLFNPPPMNGLFKYVSKGLALKSH